MKELRIYHDSDDYSDDYESLFYDDETDSGSEMAMWRLDQILYELKPGHVLKIFCLE